MTELNITHYNGRMTSTLVAVGAPPIRHQGTPVAATTGALPAGGYVRVWTVLPAIGKPTEHRIWAQATNYADGEELPGYWVATIDVPLLDNAGQVLGAQTVHVSAEPIPEL